MEESPPGGQSSAPYLPERLRRYSNLQSGWERLRELYCRDEHGEFSEEVNFLWKGAWTGFVMGGVYGGTPAARFSRQNYIKNSQAEVYQSKLEGVRAAHNAGARGFIRYGLRWGWRVAAFVTIFNAVHVHLSAYRDKVTMSNFVTAGAVTGGLFRMNLGVRAIISGSIIGGVLGAPVGALASMLQTLTGTDLRELRMERHRRLYEEKLREWNEQLQFTGAVVQMMEQADMEPADLEMERINQLLQQPRNPEPPSEE